MDSTATEAADEAIGVGAEAVRSQLGKRWPCC